MRDHDEIMDMDDVYRRYALPLKKYVMTMSHDETLSEDIVAETFYKAIKSIDSFVEGNIFTWLCTIAKNTFYNHVSKKDNSNISLEDESLPEPVASVSVEDQVLEKSERMELYRRLQTLEPLERDVIHLRIFANLSYKEIGDIIGKTETWTRVTYFRCKEKLKGQLKNE